MKLKIYTVLAGLGLVFACPSCSDSDKWEPGTPDAPDCPQVYFAADNVVTQEFFADDQVKAVPVKIKRLKTESALSVPLTLTTEATGVSIPATAEFAAGQEEVTFMIDCSGMPERQNYNINVSMPESYYAMYAKGTQAVDVKVAIVSWTVICDNVMSQVYNQSNQPLYQPTYGTLEWLEGTDRLRFSNYCGSGLTFTFRFSASTEGCSATYLDMYPLGNIYLMEGDTYGCYYLYDEANDDYPNWTLKTLDGADAVVNYFYVYRAGDTYAGITDPTDCYACVSGYLTMADGTTPWVYTWMFFDIPEEYVGLIPIEGVE